MNEAIIDRFCEVYQRLNKHNLTELTNIYSTDLIFVDAVHEIQGLDALQSYFSKLYENLSFCRFDIEETIVEQGQASIIWTMTFAHKKLKSGQSISVNGCSHLKFDERIYYHRDYLDMGQMIYEHLPLFGRAIQFVKKQVSQ